MVDLVQGVKRLKSWRNHRNLENYRDILIVLLQKEIKVRYKDKALGYLWSLANPLAYSFVYFVAFSVIMRVEVEHYPLVLMSGLFPWQWLSNSINGSSRLFISNASIIKKVYFPRNIIPMATVLNHMVHFVISMPVILLFLFLYHRMPDPSWIYGFPALLVIHLITAYGLALLVASINVFFRDLERLVSILMTFVFYFTPIIYPIDMVPGKYKIFLLLNPLAPLIMAWRELILQNIVHPLYLVASLIYGVSFLAIGYFTYKKLSWKFAEVI